MSAASQSEARTLIWGTVRWWRGIVLMTALLFAASFVLPLPFMNEVVIFTIYVVGCNFMIGRLGYISFGQPAYLAVGAYSAAFYLFYFGSNPLIGILFGVLGGLVWSLLIGSFFVRLRSDYFAMANLALAVVVFYLTEKVLVSITQGDNGLWFLTQMTSTPVLDLTIPNQFLAFGIIVMFLVFAFYKYLDGTIYGSCCLAAKLNEDKLQFIGYDNFRIRLLGFVIANTTTALAGAMYAVYLGFVSPEMSSPSRAADPVVVTLLGGVGTLFGPVVGALAYTGMKDVISKLIGNWELLIGFMLVFIMLVADKGIWGTLVPIMTRVASPGSRRARK
jgi:branched-chain amino acid transport system permease protein